MYTTTQPSGKHCIPDGIAEIIDQLGSMMFTSPTLSTRLATSLTRISTPGFFALNEGLKTIRKKVGGENYAAFVALSDKMRVHFEGGREDRTEDGIKGRDCIMDIEHILKASRKRKPR